MMNVLPLDQRMAAFAALGERLRYLVACYEQETEFRQLVQQAYLQNAWFTPEQVLFAFQSIAESLETGNLQKWIQTSQLPASNGKPKKIGVIMAGNIPLVGFHDFLCVLISGHIFMGKLASNDKILFPALAKELCKLEPAFEPLIQFTDSQLAGFDAIIATGSNNTARYFEYYFGKYPHIIRRNRNSVAVLTGTESPEDLKGLANDVFRYYGLGCRSVSKLFVPQNYDWNALMEAFSEWKPNLDSHTKYMNNYIYNKSILLLNQQPHLDNGFLLVKPDASFSSPVSVLNYEVYPDLETVKQNLLQNSELLQCIVTHPDLIENSIRFGESQTPQLWDYADHVNTLDFLMNGLAVSNESYFLP